MKRKHENKKRPYQMLFSNEEWNLVISKSATRGYSSKAEYIRDLIKNDESNNYLKEVSDSLKDVKNLLVETRVEQKNYIRDNRVNDYVSRQLLGKILLELMNLLYSKDYTETIEEFIKNIKEKAVEMYR